MILNCAGKISKKCLNMLMRQILEEHVFALPRSGNLNHALVSFQLI